MEGGAAIPHLVAEYYQQPLTKMVNFVKNQHLSIFIVIMFLQTTDMLRLYIYIKRFCGLTVQSSQTRQEKTSWTVVSGLAIIQPSCSLDTCYVNMVWDMLLLCLWFAAM